MNRNMAGEWNKPVEARGTDSESLWNYTRAPGWTNYEVNVLRWAVVHCGVGSWPDIKPFLPNKTLQQLSLQAQRLFGQQSLAEFFGLHVDPREVYIGRNKEIIEEAQVNPNSEVVLKNGCVVNVGFYMTSEELQKKKDENKREYGLSQEKINTFKMPVREKRHHVVDHEWMMTHEEVYNFSQEMAMEKLSQEYELLYKLKAEIDHRIWMADVLRDNPHLSADSAAVAATSPPAQATTTPAADSSSLRLRPPPLGHPTFVGVPSIIPSQSSSSSTGVTPAVSSGSKSSSSSSKRPPVPVFLADDAVQQQQRTQISATPISQTSAISSSSSSVVPPPPPPS